MRKISNLLGYLTSVFLTSTAIIIIQHLPGKKISLSLFAFFGSIYLFFYTLNTLSKNSNGKSKLTHYMLASVLCCINVGIMLSYLHLSFANYVIIPSLVFFSIVYAPFLYIEKSTLEPTSKLMNVFGISGLSIFTLGLLFSIMLWRHATFLLVISFVLIFFIYFPLYITNKNISKDKKSNFLNNAFLNIIIGVMLAFYVCRTMLFIKF